MLKTSFVVAVVAAVLAIGVTMFFRFAVPDAPMNAGEISLVVAACLVVVALLAVVVKAICKRKPPGGGTSPAYLALASLVAIASGCDMRGSRDTTSAKASSASALVRLQGRAYLEPGEQEQPGFGLYSYLLFGSPANDHTRDRYLEAIKAWLEVIEDVDHGVLDPQSYNVTYVPIKNKPPPKPTAQWVLDNYDFARAARILRSVPGDHLHGPYIISHRYPVRGDSLLTEQYLYQDMSFVEPRIVLPWIKLFLAQSSAPRYWEADQIDLWVLRLRNGIAIAAITLPDVAESLKKWIAFVP
jgi:hypothetical protein